VDFSVTQAQEELSALSRRILTDWVTPERLTDLERAGQGFDGAAWADLAAAGILSAAVQESAGGDGYGLAEQCSVLIELGRAVAPLPYLETIVLGANALLGQPAGYGAAAARGELIIAAALAEPAGYDLAEPGMRAEPDGAGWRLNGTKTAVPYGAVAGLFLVSAATPEGTGVFAVERGDAGVEVAGQRLVDGAGAARLHLTDVTLAAERLIGATDGQMLSWLLGRATVGLCALQLGVTERALERTAEYARSRQAFGRAIGAFQAVAQRLADAYIDVEAIRLTMWQAAWRLEAGLPAEAELATAKFWAAEGGHRVAHTAVHVHGGVGIDVSHPVHRYFAAAKRLEFALGGATAQLLDLGTILAS
jgi:alkylation response protein AidB-like acyl-CoA dehydrogenase